MPLRTPEFPRPNELLFNRYLLPHAMQADIRALMHSPDGLEHAMLQPFADLTPAQSRARDSFKQLRRQLAEDAKTFLANPPNVPRNILSLSKLTEQGMADRLSSLYRHYSGVILGEPFSSRWGKRLLIDGMLRLKQQGVNTLYLAYLLTDLHQDELDHYCARPDNQLPSSLLSYVNNLALHAQADPAISNLLLQLLQRAHASGMRIVALESLSSMHLTGLEPQVAHQGIKNYFAYQIIQTFQTRANAGKWLALMPERAISRFGDVPGVAELTGALAIRVQHEDQLPGMNNPLSLEVDRGELIEEQQQDSPSLRLHDRVQADWVLGDRPVISADDLLARLKEEGDYVMLAQPQRAAYQLRHRDQNGQIVITQIERDWYSRGFYLTRNDPGWQALYQRRFSHIQLLCQALSAAEYGLRLHNSWGTVTPILPEADQEAASVSIKPRTPPKPTSASKPLPQHEPIFRRYEVNSDTLRLLERLKKLRGKSWSMDRGYRPISAFTNEDEAARYDAFLALQRQLALDAKHFFDNPEALPTRPMLPVLTPDTTLEQMLPILLETAPGLVFGEWHNDSYSKRLLIELMPAFYQQGVRTLYLEQLLSDVHQAALDSYFVNRNSPMPESLHQHLTLMDRSHFGAPPSNAYSLLGLVNAAQQAGLRVVALDCMVSYHHSVQRDAALTPRLYPNLRLSSLNYYAHRVIGALQAQRNNPKWIALVGSAHLMRLGAIHGLPELTGAIGIRIGHSPRFLSLDNGEIFDDESNRRPMRLKTDLLLCNHPEMDELALNAPLDKPGTFLIRWRPKVATYELRYYSAQKKKIIKVPIVQSREGGWLITQQEELHLSRRTAPYTSMTQLSNDLIARFKMENVWGDAIPQLVRTASVKTPASPESSRHILDNERFVRLRQALLIHLALFGSDDERSRFRTGQQASLATLISMNLADSDLAGLRRYWLEQDATLDFEQKGALLQTIETKQQAQLQTQLAAWQEALEALGAVELKPLQQHRYLMATQRLQGVCAAMASHLAAAWLLDHQPTAPSTGAHLACYLQRLETAIETPGSDNARLLGLGLSQWSFIAPSEKFANHALRANLGLEAIRRTLEQIQPLPQAFELRQGGHALVVGVSRRAVQRRYFLADPNFGCAEFNTVNGLLKALRLSAQTLAQAQGRSSDERFTLQPYRSDLYTRKLFVTQRHSWHTNPRWHALSLADLSETTELAQRFNQGQPLEHDAFFIEQQRRLSLKEYRATLLMPGDRQTGTPTNELLRAILARHNATEAALHPSARLLNLSFHGKNAQVVMQCTPELNAQLVEVDGERHPEDVSLLLRYDQFIRLLTRSRSLSRLFSPRASFALQPAYLAAALPDDGAWPEPLQEELRQTAAAASAEPVIDYAQHDALAAQLARARQQALAMAGHFERCITALLAEEADPGRWIPILDSARELPEGPVQLEFRDRLDPTQFKQLASEDRTPLTLKSYLEQKNRAVAHLNALTPESLPGEDAMVDGLNSAFALQILMHQLTHTGKPAGSRQAALDKSLALALDIQQQLNGGQVMQGVAQDATQIVRLVKTALNAEASGTLLASSSRLFGKLGGMLQLASVGLDIYAMTKAHTESQRIVLGNRLAFDSAGLGLIGASLMGMEMTGPAGILLAGLGIGVSALVGQYVAIGERAGREVGGYFEALKHAYQQRNAIAAAYTLDPQHQALKPSYPAIVTTLDLKQGQLTLASPKLYPSRHGATGSGRLNYLFWAGDMPVMQDDPARAIDICQRLGYATQGGLPAYDASWTIVLPATPQHYIAYRYQTLPGATTRQDAGFDSLRKLEAEGDFDFDFYIFPSEWLIDQLTFSYVDTPVKVLLGSGQHRLQMPTLPETLHGYLHYQLESEGGQCVISLQPGARLKLSSPADSQTEWILDARQLTGDTLIFKSSGLRIEGIEILLQPTQAQLTLIARDGTISSLDLADKTQTVLAMDASQWPGSQDGLRDALKQLAQQHNAGQHCVLIKNYPLPASQDQPAQTLERAWFDMARQRLLYLDPGLYPKAELALLTDKQVFFYNQGQTKVLRVDADKHEVVARYALRDEPKLRVWQEGQVTLLGPQNPNAHYAAIFAIVNDQLWLVRAQASDTLMAELNQQARLSDSAKQLHKLLEDNVSLLHGQVTQLNALLPTNQWVIIDHAQAGQLKQRIWLRTHDGALLKPVFQAAETSQPEHSLSDDLTLVQTATQSNGQEHFTFYSAQNRQLYGQVGWGPVSYDPAKPTALRLNLPGIQHLSRLDGHLYASGEDGIIQQQDSEGNWAPCALKQAWFATRQANWPQELSSLSQHRTLSLLDWHRADEQPLPAWAHQGLVILAATPLTTQTRWLGLSQDQQSAWLYAPESGIVYQQGLYPQTALARAFDPQGRLQADVNIPLPQPRLRVAGLDLDGDTLSLALEDGVLPPPIQGIRQLWLAPCQMLERLSISAQDWQAYPLITLDLTRVSLPMAANQAGQATRKLQLAIQLARPWGLEISRNGDDLLLFDALSGSQLCLLDALATRFAAKADVTLQLDAERMLTLEQLQAALSQDRADLWRTLAEPLPDID